MVKLLATLTDRLEKSAMNHILGRYGINSHPGRYSECINQIIFNK